MFRPHFDSLAEAMSLSKCTPYECLLPFSILGSPLEEQKHKGREKVPSSFSSQGKCIPPLLRDVCLPCSWEQDSWEGRPTTTLNSCLFWEISSFSQQNVFFLQTGSLSLSLEGMENQSALSFLHPALSKEKCQTSLYKTNQNPPVFLNSFPSWHTSLRISLCLPQNF